MISRGIATFTLDTGRCPPWLFRRMVKLGREISYIICQEYGPQEFVKRVSDPVWFQSLGTVLAFDWNASGLTTILTAALKEGIRGNEKYFGFYVAGGKGKTSRKTPDEIEYNAQRGNISGDHAKNLVYNSRMAAKVDSALVQDGYQIYHHAFFFTKQNPSEALAKGGNNIVWSVVQQGMNTKSQTARRYHWYSDNVEDIVCEPHTGIASQTKGAALNLSSKKSTKTRETSSELARGGYKQLMRDITILRKHSSQLSRMVAVELSDGRTPVVTRPAQRSLGEVGRGSPGVKEEQQDPQQLTLLELYDEDFHTHPVVHEDFSKSKYLEKVLYQVAERQPQTYENLLAMQGVGPKTIRALSLVSEVIYGAKPSYEDPARYSFAHGGKDAIPYPVDKVTYDQTIHFFKKVISKMRIGHSEKTKIVQQLEEKRMTCPPLPTTQALAGG